MAQQQTDHSLGDFLAGLVFGFILGGTVSLLLSPRSGKENREVALKFAKELPEHIREDWAQSEQNTQAFIERQKAHLEETVEGVSYSLDAKRLAAAKKREEEANAEG